MKPKTTPAIEDYCTIAKDKIRYSDTDRQGHVNNAVFSSFLETGRVEILYDQKVRLAGENCSFVIACMKVDFLGEIVWPGEIDIGTRIAKIGRSSIDIEQGLFQHGNCVAISETVIVQKNDRTNQSMPLEAATVNELVSLIKKPRI